MTGAYYITDFLDPKSLKDAHTKVVKVLRKIGLDKFEGIAFTGISGALVAPAVAATLGKRLIVVRKRKKEGHSPFKVEGDPTIKTYVIIDDLVDEGTTVNKIVKSIHKELSPLAELVHIVLYNDGQSEDTTLVGNGHRKVEIPTSRV